MPSKRTPKSFPDTDGFALADLTLVVIAGALWYARPELSWLPLLSALLPWAVRLGFGRFPFKRTPLDVFFLLFLITALVGVWAAYDRARALAKFWLILDGVLLFYALVGQPRSNRWRIAWALGAGAVGMAAFFLLTHNWETEPAKLAFLNRLGLAWMGVRPALPVRALHPNVAAGITALLTPFLVACGLNAWLKEQRQWAGLAAAGGVLVAFALLMTTSRGAWLSLSAGLGIWFLWSVSRAVADARGQPAGRVFAVGFGGVVLAGIVFVTLFPGGLVGLANRLPGPSHTGSRLDLMNALILLTGDTPITGGGLDAFPGLYAHYILVSPSYNLEHGHNLYLDIALEQGVIGALAAITILVYGGWWMFTAMLNRHRALSSTGFLLWAGLAALITMAVHGIMDDALYGSRAQLLLWLVPGIGLSVRRTRSRKTSPDAEVTEESPSRRPLYTTSLAILALLVYMWIFRGQLMATWQANLAAVEMAQIELADFPTDEWDDGSDAVLLRPAAGRFELALDLDPENRTAHHRLGLIAALFREFNLAVEHLEAAYRLAPDHPGIRKSLAYNLVWAGRINDALPLLADIPEAQAEMGIYIFWWKSNGREDLSQRASVIAETLALP